MRHDLPPIRPARVAWIESTPLSVDYGDRYFSAGQAEAEAEAVFIAGCELDDRFTSLSAGELFVIGEIGFGTGRKLLKAAERFLELAPADAELTLISAELHPLEASDLERALSDAQLPAPLVDSLLTQYPSPVPGFHSIRLAPNIELILMYGDAQAVWARQGARVDAWFLDGFAPSHTPALWRPELFRLLAGRSRPGATLASFSVAAKVREALSAAGFVVRREPGFGRKRHRLCGHWPGTWRPFRPRRGAALIAGAGLAGATCARALAERGWQVTVGDPAGIASGASGNRIAVVYTHPGGHGNRQNRLYQMSYLRSLAWLSRHRLEAHGSGRFDGLVQHLVTPRLKKRLQAALDSGWWPRDELVRLDESRVLLRRAGCIDPVAWCRRLLDHPRIELRPRAVALEHNPHATIDGGSCDALIVCTASVPQTLATLPLRRIPGQVTEIHATAESARFRRVQCHEGYLSPALHGLHVAGATYRRGGSEHEPLDEDDRANLALLRRHLPRHWQALGGDRLTIAGHRVGVRVQTPDFLPVVGRIDGLDTGPVRWLNLAHGSRGVTNTPLVADLIADRLSNRPDRLERTLAELLDPGRFGRIEPESG